MKRFGLVALLALVVLSWSSSCGRSSGRHHDYDRNDDYVYQPPPPRPPLPPPDYDWAPDHRPQRWVQVGARRVDHRRPEMVVIPARNLHGRFRQMRLTVNGGPLEVYDVDVELDNGRIFSPNVRPQFGENVRTHVFDLPGAVRGVRQVRFLCRCLRPGDRPTITVFAR